MNKEEVKEGIAHLKWLLDNGILTREDEPHFETVLNYIEKLEKALSEKIKYCNELEKDLFENCSNYVVPKQVVLDKIEQLKKELNYIGGCKKDCEKCFTTYRGSNFVYCYAYHQIKVLQEILNKGELT